MQRSRKSIPGIGKRGCKGPAAGRKEENARKQSRKQPSHGATASPLAILRTLDYSTGHGMPQKSGKHICLMEPVSERCWDQVSRWPETTEPEIDLLRPCAPDQKPEVFDSGDRVPPQKSKAKDTGKAENTETHPRSQVAPDGASPGGKPLIGEVNRPLGSRSRHRTPRTARE